MGTTNGFQIYQTDPLAVMLTRDLYGGVMIIEMIFVSNLFALVGGGDNPFQPNNKVIIWDDKET